MKRSGTPTAERVPRILYFTGAILVGTILATLVVEALLHHDQPRPREGVLDLRTWSFASHGPVALEGSWPFDPGRLVGAQDFGASGKVWPRMVPDTRFSYPGRVMEDTGSGTYRMQVRLPPGVSHLGLRHATIWTAFEVEVNGAVVARVGDPDAARPGYGGGIVSIPSSGGDLDILVRVSNTEYRWGGIIQPLVLGALADLQTQKRWDDMLVFVVTGALLGVAANALFLFAFRRRDSVYLWFSTFAVIVALRALTSGDVLLTVLFPDLGFDPYVRIEYVSVFLLLPTAALFFYRLFKEDFSRWELGVFLVPHAAFALLIPFASITVLTWSLLPYLAIAVVLMLYGYYAACLRPALRRRPGAGIVMTAGTVMLAAVLANMHTEILKARAESAFPWGLAVFVIVQSLVMAKRFTWAFDRNETLTSELKLANRQLMEEARAAEDARDELEATLNDKEILLKEVHHRVKNSLQIVTSIINLQVRRATDPGVVAAYGAVRDRIRALSSVHERLFGLDSEKRIDLPQYLQDLIEQFRESYPDTRAEFQVETEPIEVSMELCSEIGLMLTELVLNAYRFAIMPAGGGIIRVCLKREGQGMVSLTVADQGPGFPPGFSPSSLSTVGYRIISSLLTQRGGSVVVDPGPGASVTIQIPSDPEPISTRGVLTG